MPSLLDQVSYRDAPIGQAATAPLAPSIYEDPVDDPRRLPLVISLPLITALSLGLWVGIGLLLGVLPMN